MEERGGEGQAEKAVGSDMSGQWRGRGLERRLKRGMRRVVIRRREADEPRRRPPTRGTPAFLSSLPEPGLHPLAACHSPHPVAACRPSFFPRCLQLMVLMTRMASGKTPADSDVTFVLNKVR